MVLRGPSLEARLEGCEIWGCEEDGVRVEEVPHSGCVILNNKIYQSGRAGVAYQGRGTMGLLQGNEIFLNASGVEVGSGAGPDIKANFIHDHAVGAGFGGSGWGVWVDSKGRETAVARDNIFLRNEAGDSYFRPRP